MVLQTHANHPHVVQTVSAKFQMVKAYVLVCLSTEDLHRIADLHVSSAVNVLQIRCAKTKNVYHPALDHVEITRNVE